MAHRLAPRGGVDLEALSPRDANAQRVPKVTDIKTKTAAQLKAAKEKEHPPPPPTEVPEPPSTDRPDGATYQVGKLLGKGGFAVCYSGQLLPTKQRFALKIVKSHMPPKMEQKFQTELQIHSKMKHKNIVQFLRAFSYEKCTYLILELCPNGSLMDMVKRRKGLTEPEVRFYSVQIAGAIKYMHNKGIIHRDLKMGNIFLDSQMNAKIGDFGLAALLVTGRDMHTIRRTTLCGTPNYIAPEILEKGKKGHDHMVDIWSLGIIMYAMFTSKPPFQSSTTDEIYRRARERDYDWPSAETSRRYISQEAKELVATMLQDAESRPEPEAIIQHPFFTCGYMPTEAEMSSRLREVPPDREEFYATRMSSALQAQSYRNFKDMCRECGIGPYAPVQVVHTQTWKEMAAEEKAGLTPMIPLEEGIVYRPFEEWLKEQQQIKARYTASLAAQASMSTEDPLSATQRAPAGLLRQPPQSFAAQQRMQHRPAGTMVSAKPRPAPEATLSASQSLRTRTRKELPREAPPRETVESVGKSLRTSTRSAPPARAASQQPAERQLSERPSLDRQASAPATTAPPAPAAPPKKDTTGMRPATLFSASERQDRISGTKPDMVLDRLHRLQNELERALNSRTMAIISSKTVAPPHPHVVVKWVDYTNKFGLGYILNDGSVGCILRDIPTTENGKPALLPPAGVFIRGAERHIVRGKDETYEDRVQPLPMTEPIKFFENNGEAGLSEVVVSPEQFRVAVKEDGTAGKMQPGRDIFQHRKRERIILWKKFANYMIAFGRDDFVPVEETDPAGAMSPGQKGTVAELVTFYQRFGDVGCWVFCDGHLQPLALAEPQPQQEDALSAANDFRRKIVFIKDVVKEWVTNGGLGNSQMSRESRLRWGGHRETISNHAPQKHVWVTVGARWGDQRISTYVDPRKPWELGEDVDYSRKQES
ncbi:Cell cycle serine/threonine-protein kinase CDC5/MSD2 [Fusarium oxysporum f. sp. cubense race 1]|uniref:Cell cycle serine/threonine-protein kinase CDC5/MSD2 n=1 Tax=Fusarium oxysporum f. sp. cubense (strain race 1) TaxID=1229664 RepID=N4TSQ2_FUSC1|nr:Cell cycle serine/threonine-protein kinase CDC5/MSD2 [Fusarium oxysporum f. sp. cubense race 1]